MTLRTFWAILIKILGVYIILESLVTIPQFLGIIVSYSQQGDGINKDDSLIAISYLLLIAGIYILILWCCIYRTDTIINNLKLDQGYTDERLEFNIHRSTVLKIIVIVMGGLLLIEGFPKFCQYIIAYSQVVKNYNKITDVPATKYIVFTSVQMFIGYFMLTCSRMIVNFIERKRRDSDSILQ